MKFEMVGQKYNVWTRDGQVTKTQYASDCSLSMPTEEFYKVASSAFQKALLSNYRDFSCVRNCDKKVWCMEVTTERANEIHTLQIEETKSGTVITAYEHPGMERIVDIQFHSKSILPETIECHLKKHELYERDNVAKVSIIFSTNIIRYSYEEQKHVSRLIDAMKTASFKCYKWEVETERRNGTDYVQLRFIVNIPDFLEHESVRTLKSVKITKDEEKSVWLRNFSYAAYENEHEMYYRSSDSVPM